MPERGWCAGGERATPDKRRRPGRKRRFLQLQGNRGVPCALLLPQQLAWESEAVPDPPWAGPCLQAHPDHPPGSCTSTRTPSPHSDSVACASTTCKWWRGGRNRGEGATRGGGANKSVQPGTSEPAPTALRRQLLLLQLLLPPLQRFCRAHRGGPRRQVKHVSPPAHSVRTPCAAQHRHSATQRSAPAGRNRSSRRTQQTPPTEPGPRGPRR